MANPDALEDLPLHGRATVEDDEGVPIGYTIYNFENLGQIDLNGELAAQYSSAKTLLAMVEGLTSVPANQKAQVINTLTNLITQIIKLQEQVYNIKRIKCLEDALIAALRMVPEDAQQKFYEVYENALESIE